MDFPIARDCSRFGTKRKCDDRRRRSCQILQGKQPVTTPNGLISVDLRAFQAAPAVALEAARHAAVAIVVGKLNSGVSIRGRKVRCQ